MAGKILDSQALIVFFEGRNGSDQIRNFLLKAEEKDIKLYICTISMGEFWYALAKSNNSQIAEKLIHEIQGMAIEMIDPNYQITNQAYVYKLRYNLPLSACFAPAVAKVKKAELIANDRIYAPLEGEIKIFWL